MKEPKTPDFPVKEVIISVCNENEDPEMPAKKLKTKKSKKRVNRKAL